MGGGIGAGPLGSVSGVSPSAFSVGGGKGDGDGKGSEGVENEARNALSNMLDEDPSERRRGEFRCCCRWF